MKLVVIEKFPVPIGNFKNVTPQPAAYGVYCQQIVATNAILLGQELDADNHGSKLPCCLYTKKNGNKQLRGLKKSCIQGPMLALSKE